MDGGYSETKCVFNKGGYNNMKYNYFYTDGSKCEIVTVSKDLLQNCNMTAEGFEQCFFNAAKTSSTYMEAYEKVEIMHEDLFNHRRYSDYDSFRKSKAQRHK